MSVATLRPDSTVSNTGTVTGAATAHAALSDDSDASYVLIDEGETVEVGLGDLALPGGAVIKKVEVRARVRKQVVLNSEINAVVPLDIDYIGTLAITWATPTTVVICVVDQAGTTDAEADAATLRFVAIHEDTQIHEAYLDVTYIDNPVLSAFTYPSGTITNDASPDVLWSYSSLDADGGPQTHYHVKVFSDAQYGAGGFDPETSTPTYDSGETASADNTHELADLLDDDIYKAYVRGAQTVSGEQLWSQWDETAAFTINIDKPGVPTLTLTSQSAFGRVRVNVEDNAGTVTTDGYQVQISSDGLTWRSLRTTLGSGLIEGPGLVSAYDYEAPNGAPSYVRARAVHLFSPGQSYSPWTATETTTWQDEDNNWWLKHPTRPSLNAPVGMRSQPVLTKEAPQGVFKVLGRPDPVVVTDTRQLPAGEVVFKLTTEAMQASVDTLLDEVCPLLLQSPAAAHWQDRWVVFGTHERARIIDASWYEPTFDTVPFQEVARPDEPLAE